MRASKTTLARVKISASYVKKRALELAHAHANERHLRNEKSSIFAKKMHATGKKFDKLDKQYTAISEKLSRAASCVKTTRAKLDHDIKLMNQHAA